MEFYCWVLNSNFFVTMLFRKAHEQKSKIQLNILAYKFCCLVFKRLNKSLNQLSTYKRKYAV